MKKFIMRCLALLAVLVSVTTTTETAFAQGLARPAGARLVLVSECRIDFESSVYWTGNSEDVVIQIFWLMSQLPEKCLEQQCSFTNIDPDWFLILIPRFLEKFKYDVRLQELGTLVTTAFKDCSIEANPRQLLYPGSSGSLSCGGDGNTLILSVAGSNDSFSSTQVGCNVGGVQINGNNVTVHITQFGQNQAIVVINGNNIVFTLVQYGNNSYNGTITEPGVYNVLQSN